jgi:pimeloyl-ACP methyl ester carboxylesterase
MSAAEPAAGRAAAPSRARRVLRIIRRVVVGAVALIVLVLGVGSIYQRIAGSVPDGRYPAPWRLVDIGGRLLHVNCTGQGTPTVVLEAGLGSGAVTWQHVQRPLSDITRVCSYDRAGYGWSASGPSPRTSARVTDDLHRLLEKAGVQGPLVLAGHSLGGLFARHYAARYPTEIAGMVLVDSTHEDQDKPPAAIRMVVNLLGRAGITRALFQFDDPGLNAMYKSNRSLDATFDEFAAVEESSNQTREAHFSFGSKPLIVLTAGSNDADPAWQRLQKELATRSSNGKRIVATGSGHYIQDDRPELVIAAVREVIAATKGTTF